MPAPHAVLLPILAPLIPLHIRHLRPVPAFWLYLTCIFLSFPSLFSASCSSPFYLSRLTFNSLSPGRLHSLYIAVELPLPHPTPPLLFSRTIVHVVCTCYFLILLTVQMHFVMLSTPHCLSHSRGLIKVCCPQHEAKTQGSDRKIA